MPSAGLLVITFTVCPVPGRGKLETANNDRHRPNTVGQRRKMDLQKALAAAMATGIMPFPALKNNEKTNDNLIISSKNPDTVKGAK
jgi:hypothetical protein